MKGLPIAAVPQGNHVEVWISSPTGDSSDSYTHLIPCHNADQARGLANAWSKMIENIMYSVDADLYEVIQNLRQENSELRHWEEAAQDRIKNLSMKLEAVTTTLIKHYDKSWFDQTVSF